MMTTPTAHQPGPAGPLLVVSGLGVEFATEGGQVRVVHDARLTLARGRTRALVGESGSGKTVTALAIMGLIPQPSGRVVSGEVWFEGRDLLQMPQRQLQRVRGRDIGMIFQEPMSSLNPAYTVGEQIAEVVRRHRGLNRKQSWRRAVEMLGTVGIPSPAERASDYPHAFSGGMRQRVMIAMALSCEPALLIADEPTTALDVTVQAAILQLLRELQEQLDMAVLLVTHDLGVVADFSDDVSVMYAGQVVEAAPTYALFEAPQHPYTGGLLSAVPQASLLGRDLVSIPGVVPRPDRMPSGCRFHPRCPQAVIGRCDTGDPELVLTDLEHATRCLRVQRNEIADTKRGYAPDQDVVTRVNRPAGGVR